VTDQAEPGRPPAHDLAAFDVSKRTPEQIALSFARWKEQRKRPQQGPETARAGRPAHPRPVPVIARGAARDSAPVSEEATDRNPARGPVEEPRAIQYSTPFAALLAAGSEPTAAHRIWYPDARLPRLRRAQPTRRHPKVAWVVTGAASVVAVAAMAGGALLEQSEWRSPAEAKPSAAQVHPLDIPMAEPFAAVATTVRGAEWKLRQTIDLALMKAASTVEAVRPPVPVVQTASKAAAAPKSAPAAQPLSEPELQFVPKPFVPSVAPATANIPAAPAAAAGLDGDPRPDGLVQRGHDTRNNTFGANNRVAAPGSKPGGAAGSGSVDPRSASSRSGGAATAGASDPASGATSGDGDGDGSGAGGDTGGGDTGGGDSGSGDGSGQGGSAGSGGLGGGTGTGTGGAESEDKDKDKSD
jgi:hypothetical protein